jgi:hypothetical protein
MDYPDDVLCAVFSSLSIRSIAKCATVCRNWQRIIADNKVYNNKKFLVPDKDLDSATLMLHKHQPSLEQITILSYPFYQKKKSLFLEDMSICIKSRIVCIYLSRCVSLTHLLKSFPNTKIFRFVSCHIKNESNVPVPKEPITLRLIDTTSDFKVYPVGFKVSCLPSAP